MKKVKLSFKENDYNAEIESYAALIPHFKNVLDAYNSMGLPELTQTEFKQLFSNAQSVIFDKMTNGKEIEINGFKIDKTNALNILQKPAGYSVLIACLEDVKKEAAFSYHLSNVIIEDCEIVLIPSLVDSIREKNTIYARTEKQLKAYEFTMAVIAKATECFGDGLDVTLLLREFMHPFNEYGFDSKHKINFSGIVNFGEPR